MSNLYAAAQYLLFVFIVTALVKPLGGYMERGVCRKAVLDRFCCPVERLLYRIAWVDATVEMTSLGLSAEPARAAGERWVRSRG